MSQSTPTASANATSSFLVQFTEHTTYELEIASRSAEQAIQIATDQLAAFGTSVFVEVEQDLTDWIAIMTDARPLLRSSVISEEVASEEYVSPSVPLLQLSAEERRQVVELLSELRDFTLSRASYERATHLIAILAGDGQPRCR